MITRHTKSAKWLVPIGLLIQIGSVALIPITEVYSVNPTPNDFPITFITGLLIGTIIHVVGTIIHGIGLSQYAQAKGYPTRYGIVAILNWIGLLLIAVLPDKTLHSQCQVCGYSIKGLESSADCPECGAPIKVSPSL